MKNPENEESQNEKKPQKKNHDITEFAMRLQIDVFVQLTPKKTHSTIEEAVDPTSTQAEPYPYIRS